jgi:hypothetical protein
MKDFIVKAFSDNGTPSSSRLLSAVCTLAVIVWGTYFVWHTRALPDGLTMGGMATLATSHLGVSKISSAIKGD